MRKFSKIKFKAKSLACLQGQHGLLGDKSGSTPTFMITLSQIWTHLKIYASSYYAYDSEKKNQIKWGLLTVHKVKYVLFDDKGYVILVFMVETDRISTVE